MRTTDFDSLFASELSPESGTGNPLKVIGSTGDQGVDGLLTDRAWADVTIDYSFPTSNIYGYTQLTDLPNGMFGLTLAQQNATHFALNAEVGVNATAKAGFSVEGFTNLGVFNDLSPDGDDEIRLANTTAASLGTARVADFPGNYLTGQTQDNGDVWFGTSYNYTNPIAGNYAWHTTLHEIGHALGLKHAQEGGFYGAMPDNINGMEYTVMSYRSYINGPNGPYSNEAFGYAQTYMMYDIAALQHMYGADFSTNSGNTTYSWTPGSGDTRVNGVAAIQPGANRIFATIWDGGGFDTYDLSAYTTNLSIDLNPGGYSSFSSAQKAYLGGGPNSGYARGNIFNALQFNGDARSLIEAAIGGSGNDSMVGNVADNSLNGNAGNDTLKGLGGADSLYGGDGDDYLDGGDGNDVLKGMGGADDLYGGNGDDHLDGGDGEDFLSGGAGADDLYGGAGNDAINSGDGEDTVTAGAGDDVITDDIAMFTDDDDVYDGGDGVDTLVHDLNWVSTVAFNLTAGWATLDGQNRDQLLNIENLTVGGSASVTGSGAANVLTVNGLGANVINALGGADTVNAGGGNDSINAGSGQDSVAAGDGNDVMIDTEGMGASDDDVYNGGAGYDTLVHNLNWSSSVAFNLSTGWATFGGNRDRLISIENLTLNGSASVTGSNVANILTVNGTGANVISGLGGADTISAGGGNDTVNGGGGNDRINAGADEDTALGGDGNDIFTDTQGMNAPNDDVYNGGAGTDTLVHDLNWVSSVAFNLTTGWSTYNGNRDRLISVENLTVGGAASVTGNGAANVLTVNGTGANVVNGLGGDDTISAGGGGDVLRGGFGADSLLGGAGADFFDYNSPTESSGADTDLVRDFEFNIDRIDLRDIDANRDVLGIQDFTLGLGVGQLSFANLGNNSTLIRGNITSAAGYELQIEVADGGVTAATWAANAASYVLL